MAIANVTDNTKFLQWKEITNEIITSLGDINNLSTTDKTNLVNAINEIDAEIGNLLNLSTDDKSNLVNAINEIDTLITTINNDVGTNTSNISTNASNISTNSTNIGTIGDLDTIASDLVNAVNEVKASVSPSGAIPYFENFGNGRFSLDTGASITTYNKGVVFNSNNSSTFASGDKFINDNSDNGGSSGNMGADALSLLAKLVTNGRTEQRYGYEFFISKITAGGGTGNVINFNSTNYYPQTNTNYMYLGSIGESITWSGYVKNNDATNAILLGDTNPNIDTYIDGSLQASPYELTNATGWVHFRQKLFLTQEFRLLFPLISATTGNSSVIQVALSTLYRADVPDVQLGVVM